MRHLIYWTLLGFWASAATCGDVSVGMGNPFSFEVDGVRFDEESTPDEKAEWGDLVARGMGKKEAARMILRRRPGHPGKKKMTQPWVQSPVQPGNNAGNPVRPRRGAGRA